MRSAEYQRGYDAGYKEALLDAVRLERSRVDRQRRQDRDGTRLILGGPKSRFLPRGVPGSIYND